jgi:tungstate transport system ATP-binding protein
MDILPMMASGIESRRRGQQLVGPIDLTLEGQGATVVIGPNGAGKTTLLQLLHGTARLSAGRIEWACSTDEARQHQGFVFQRPVMLRRTVMENMIYPLRLRGVPNSEARDKAREWAARVGLEPLLDRSAPVLSGGEQQKLALARALICEPKLLFLDEPCAALDGRATREIEDILLTAKTGGTRLVLSTHDLGQARRLADEVIFLLGGAVHEAGRADSFFNRPATPQARAFLRGDIVE